MFRKLATVALLACLASPLPMMAQAPTPNATAVPTVAHRSWTIPINGYVVGGGTVAGTYQIQKFVVQNNRIMAIGNLIVNVTHNGATKTVTVAGQAIPLKTPAAGAAVTPAAACSILDLTLGPLDLNLLGLQVHLNTVVLDITAQPGAGALLGNLLCAVANLLNSGGALTQIAGLLNQLIGALSNLGL